MSPYPKTVGICCFTKQQQRYLQQSGGLGQDNEVMMAFLHDKNKA